MDNLNDKIAHIESMRALIGDAAADAAIAALRTETPMTRQSMAAEDGGQITAATQQAAGGARGKVRAEQHMQASNGGRISGAAQVTGDHAQITINPAPIDHVADARERALIDYLSMVQGECSSLQLSRIDSSESRYHRPMRLEQVYIGLHTTSQVVETADDAAEAPTGVLKTLASRLMQLRGEHPETKLRSETKLRPLTALEAVARGTPPRLMLLGAPGSGKSTFVNHLVLCLAAAALAERGLSDTPDTDEWLGRLDGWQLGGMLPVRVILREFAAFPPLAQTERGSLNLLLDFLRQTLGAHAEALDLIRAELTGGRVILLFDGLDEVVGDTVLARVVESIADAARIYGRCPIVTTCRVLDYQANPLRQLRGFEPETLAPLTDEQIDQFVGAWYHELAASGREMLGNANALRQAVASRPELRDLARLPLLLTMMAVVHAGKGRLPDARALLYYECIDLLLLRWRQEPGHPDVLEQLALPQFRASDLLALMARIGFAAHQAAARDSGQAERPANLSREQVQRLLEEALAPYSAGDPVRRDTLVSQLLHVIALRNGLLLKQSGEQGESYAFPHRTFQEFLAGYHLKGQRDYRRLCLEHAPQAHWHEALALMIGYQVLADRELEKPLDLAEKLLTRTPGEQALAGELLVLIGRERAASYDPALVAPGGLWPRARATLLRLATQGQTPEAPATLRVRAGLALGQLCYGELETLCQPDTRIPLPDRRLPLAVVGVIKPDAPAWRQALDEYWCPVAAGPFWHGDDSSNEPLQQLELPHSYKIGRYPVTNADYARFVAAGGYTQQQWWTDEGWKWRLPGGHRYSWENNEQPITEPWLWRNTRYNQPTQPVVGISWYEAAAYCNWLTRTGHQAGWLPKSDILRLPTSLEWERAARHTDKRRYPWGRHKPNPERANYDESEIGRPAPVGCFPAGMAVCGAHDMVGNVIEWMTTSMDKPLQLQPHKDFTQNDRILLSSGAYWGNKEQLFCGARDGYNPLFRYIYLGFRVLWSRALIV